MDTNRASLDFVTLLYLVLLVFMAVVSWLQGRQIADAPRPCDAGDRPRIVLHIIAEDFEVAEPEVTP